MRAPGSGCPPGSTASPRLTPAADALLHTDVPVIAAVNGAAVGWGMELALMADLRVASEKARFGELFVKRGLCSDAPGIGRLAQLVGRERAAELLFTGRIIAGRRGCGDGPRLPGRAPRRPAPDRHGTRAGDRRQPAARGAADEGCAAGDARPRLARARPLGEREPRPSCSRPPITARASPRSSRSANRGSRAADHRPRARSVDVSTRCGRPRRARRR